MIIMTCASLHLLEVTLIFFNCLFRQTSRWTCSSATGRGPWAVWPHRRREPGGSCWWAPTTAPSAWETPRTDCCCALWRDTPKLCSAWRWETSELQQSNFNSCWSKFHDAHDIKSVKIICLERFSFRSNFFLLFPRWSMTWYLVDPVISVSTHTTSMWVAVTVFHL